MLPPSDHPNAPKKAKKTAFRCQSLRPDSSTAARLARAPGIIAPYSWPKLPRIPQPIESERPTHRTQSRPGFGGLTPGARADAGFPANSVISFVREIRHAHDGKVKISRATGEEKIRFTPPLAKGAKSPWAFHGM